VVVPAGVAFTVSRCRTMHSGCDELAVPFWPAIAMPAPLRDGDNARAMSSDEESSPVRRRRAIERPRIPPGPLAELKALLYELYLQAGTPTLDEIAAWIADDQQVAGWPGRDTVTRIIGGTAMPPSQADVTTVATVLARAARWDPQDAARRARELWVAARMAIARIPAAGIAVSDADPRLLGVHAAISVPGMPDEVPPEYVPRDADGGESGVRAKVEAAASRGGFVLLVGGSSVGKTRSAFEAVKALLPEWWLVHPAGPGEVSTLAAAPTPRTVVWLDELQRYMDGERGLTGAMIRVLLSAPHPAVVIATLWPDRYTSYTTLPPLGGADPHARERQVLDLADVVHIAPAFSRTEQDRARAAAARDLRLRISLRLTGYGLTQSLAAAPQLVARWENADPYARAVLTAVLDAARLGARAPVTAGFLRAAAPGYCTSQEQAEAPGDWFEQALPYCTGKLHGAASALAPVGTHMGKITGYTAADYLIQHASQERRSQRVPASTWDAILTHVNDPADTTRLAISASNRLLYRYAIPLYRNATDARDEYAAWQLADLLAQRGDLDEAVKILRAWVNSDGKAGTLRMARLLAKHGALDQLRALADAGNLSASAMLNGFSLGQSYFNVDQLKARADVGDSFAAWELAHLLAKQGDLDQLRARAYFGDPDATRELGGDGDLNEDARVEILRARANASPSAAQVLAQLLAERGDLDEAAQILRPWADRGLQVAALRLAHLLAERGDLDQLRARADAGDLPAAVWLAGVLAEYGDLDQLRAQADVGDLPATRQLARLLAERGNLDEAAQILHTLADVGDGYASPHLGEVLVKQGRHEEAERLRRFGLNPDGAIASA
jgi:predicted negative regulator of RcsB-dependent stress response